MKIVVQDIPDQQFCTHCHAEIFPAECLRLWEEVNDYQSNAEALNRFMMAELKKGPHSLRHTAATHRYAKEKRKPSLDDVLAGRIKKIAYP